jgi:hypothetical protein
MPMQFAESVYTRSSMTRRKSAAQCVKGILDALLLRSLGKPALITLYIYPLCSNDYGQYRSYDLKFAGLLLAVYISFSWQKQNLKGVYQRPNHLSDLFL